MLAGKVYTDPPPVDDPEPEIPPAMPAEAPDRPAAGWTHRDQWPREWADVARRYRFGESLSVIAAATGLDPSTVAYRLQRMGVPRRDSAEATRQARRIELDEDELLRLRREGMTMADVARRLGTTESTVSRRLAALERAGRTAPPPAVEATAPHAASIPAERSAWVDDVADGWRYPGRKLM